MHEAPDPRATGQVGPSRRVAILGNAGSGKTTLARVLAGERATRTEGGDPEPLPVLELDAIFWEPGLVAVKRPVERVHADLDRFCAERPAWIIEGCYGSLVARALVHRPELWWLDPGEEVCLRRCRERAWEPQKYASPADQDAQLSPLLDFVRGYYRPDAQDDLSRRGHAALFDGYDGPKRLVR